MTQVPTTHDFLSPNKYKVVIDRFPHVEFFTQSVPVPTVTLGAVLVPTNADVDMKYPGDKVEYEDLMLSLVIDENLEAFGEILTWLQDAAASEKSLTGDVYSDISIITLTNNTNRNRVISFKNCWPQIISNIMLDSTVSEDQPLTVDAIFKYTHYTIE